jgi:serine/threonine-protein kinase
VSTEAQGTAIEGGDTLLKPGAMLGPYRLNRSLGAGGMGAVWEAVHTGLDKQVAIKTLHASIAQSELAVRRFLREGKAASRIKHPHAIDVTDVGVHDGTPYLVMERLDGEDLAQLLARRGRLSVRRTAAIMLPVASALAAAHEQGIIHRDLKPANIFLERGLRGHHPKILDFGLAKLLEGTSVQLTGKKSMLGTPHYMAPEQARSAAQVDALSDQYSLGVILYECLTGKLPFEAETLHELFVRILDGHCLPPRHHRPELPEPVEAVIIRAMALAPRERFASVRELGGVLLGFADERDRLLWQSEFGDPERRDSAAQTSSERDRAAFATTVDGPLPPTELVPTLINPDERRRVPALLWGGLAAAALVVATVAIVALSPEEATETSDAANDPPDEASAPASDVSAERAGDIAAATGGPAGQTVETFALSLDVEPASATIELDGEPIGTGSIRTKLARSGPRRLTIRADGHRDFVSTFVDVPPGPRIVLEPLASDEPPPVRGDEARRPRDRSMGAGRVRMGQASPAVELGRNEAPIIE